VTSARSEILARVRAAIAARPGRDTPVPRTYRQAGDLPAEDRIRLFCQRVADYRAEIECVDATQIAPAIRRACERHGARRMAIAAGLPTDWHPAGVELIDDTGLDAHALDDLDGAITGCTVAVAETGTLALAAGPHEGRRAVTLVPDLHICVVQAEQIVELLPEALAVLGELVIGERRPITLISGPSATSDIELARVEGVHGPRKLAVLVVGEHD